MPRSFHVSSSKEALREQLIQAFSEAFHPVCKAASLSVMVAEDMINLLRQAVRSMLAALQMPDVDDNELYDLTLHIGYTGKLESLPKPLP